jgi:hypothetical protein
MYMLEISYAFWRAPLLLANGFRYVIFLVTPC